MDTYDPLAANYTYDPNWTGPKQQQPMGGMGLISTPTQGFAQMLAALRKSYGDYLNKQQQNPLNINPPGIAQPGQVNPPGVPTAPSSLDALS